MFPSLFFGAHQLTWNKDYEAELVVDIQSFTSAVISEIQEIFPDRLLLNSMKIFDILIGQITNKN